MQLLQLKLFLTLFLHPSIVNFFNLGDHRLNMLFVLLNLVILLANLQIRIKKKLEESAYAGTRAF